MVELRFNPGDYVQLKLAQFRELEAFAQFSSDLDEATKQQIERGRRTTEILKQGQYEPMSVENQVAIIYATINGFLDDVEIERVGEWERKFHEFLNMQRGQLLEKIRTEKALSQELEAELKQAIEDFKRTI